MNLFAAADVGTIIGIVALGALLVFLFIYPSMTGKKRQKQIAELYKSVSVGDKIKTVGGIIGTVIEIDEISAVDTQIVLETGVGENKTTMILDMQAVYQNLTRMSTPSVNSSTVADESVVDSEAESGDEATPDTTKDAE